MDSHQTRETLIARVQDRYDDSAWQEFVAAYENYIYVIIRRMGLSPEDSEDLRQVILVKLWEKLPQFEYNSGLRFRSWLATVTRNTVLDHIKARRRKAAHMDDASAQSLLASLDAIGIAEVEQLAEREWELYLSNLALQNISKQFTGHAIEVFRMALDGEGSDSIAAALGIKRNTVNQLRKRVQDRLTAEIRQLRTQLE